MLRQEEVGEEHPPTPHPPHYQQHPLMEDAGSVRRVVNCPYESMGENPRQEEGE